MAVSTGITEAHLRLDWLNQSSFKPHWFVGLRCCAERRNPQGWKAPKPYIRIVPQPR